MKKLWLKIFSKICTPKVVCEICKHNKFKHEVLFMSGHDYMYYAANNVCKDCL